MQVYTLNAGTLLLSMTLTERYSNDTMIRNYVRIYDPGHSWLEVPIRDVRAAGVYGKITQYSYIKGGKQYLEEDIDMYTFYKAMIDKGYTINIADINVNDFDTYLSNK